MALDPIPYAPPQPIDGYEIRAITDSAGLEDHIITASAGFEIPEELVRPIIAADLFRRSGRTVYVGHAGGEPVTTGLGVRTGPVIGVYNIATVESARRRGFGEAMTARVAADGHAAGCEAAILQASPMGRPIYERMGYRTIIEYDGYIEPEPEPDASEPASAEDPATA
jgi:GNAT superfamily N-acetyltransferase